MCNVYSKMAEGYMPDEIKVLFIAESPPQPSYDEDEPLYYFYNVADKRKTSLAGRMAHICNIPLSDSMYNLGWKAEFLKRFKENGFFLIDYCYTPLNKLGKIRSKCWKNPICHDSLLTRINDLKPQPKYIILLLKSKDKKKINSKLKRIYGDRYKQVMFPMCGKKELDDALKDLGY